MTSSEALFVVPPEPLESALSRLGALTRVLDATGGATLALSVVAPMLLLAGTRHTSDVISVGVWSFTAGSGLVWVVAGLAIVGGIVYEVVRRRGDALFDEVSSELQWFVRERNASGRVAEYRPHLEARIILREFAQAGEMPFLGRFGPTICIAFNMIIAALAFVYSR